MTPFTYQERFKTLKGVFDAFTERTLFELQSRHHFDELLSPLKVGKESNVFLAAQGRKIVIVKIYRMQNCDFKRMYNYIRKDPRYDYLKSHPRQVILAWTQREYKNLVRAVEARVHVPKVIAWMNHILVEEMIGKKEPALPLKDALPKNPGLFFKLVVGEMKKLYAKGLIHGDLSAFNILNFEEKPYFIDFSQSTLVNSLNSEELIVRDVYNIVHFFQKMGVKTDVKVVLKFIKKSGKV